MQSLRERPVFLELIAVELGPLLHKPSGARGQLAVQRIARADSDSRAVFRGLRMEMRRVMIVEEHRYHDATEDADRRQELEVNVASGQCFGQLAQNAVSSLDRASDRPDRAFSSLGGIARLGGPRR